MRSNERAHAPRVNDILEAAVYCFNELGYAATSIQQIADRIGLHKGSLYHYISSKEDLLYRILDDMHVTLFANMDVVRAAEVGAPARLRIFINGHIRLLAQNLMRGRIFYTEFRHLSNPRRESILAERDRYERFVRELLRAGQQEGSFSTKIDSGIAAAALLSLLNSICLWYDPEGPTSVVELQDHFGDFILRGLGYNA